MQNLTVQLEANRHLEARESLAHTQGLSSQDQPSRHNPTLLIRLPIDMSTATTSTQQNVRRQTIESTIPHEPHPYYMSLQQASSLTFPHHDATQSHSYRQCFPHHLEDNVSFCEATGEEEGVAQLEVTPL
jgi:hypothetical protein